MTCWTLTVLLIVISGQESIQENNFKPVLTGVLSNSSQPGQTPLIDDINVKRQGIDKKSNDEKRSNDSSFQNITPPIETIGNATLDFKIGKNDTSSQSSQDNFSQNREITSSTEKRGEKEKNKSLAPCPNCNLTNGRNANFNSKEFSENAKRRQAKALTTTKGLQIATDEKDAFTPAWKLFTTNLKGLDFLSSNYIAKDTNDNVSLSGIDHRSPKTTEFAEKAFSVKNKAKDYLTGKSGLNSSLSIVTVPYIGGSSSEKEAKKSTSFKQMEHNSIRRKNATETNRIDKNEFITKNDSLANVMTNNSYFDVDQRAFHNGSSNQRFASSVSPLNDSDHDLLEVLKLGMLMGKSLGFNELDNRTIFNNTSKNTISPKRASPHPTHLIEQKIYHIRLDSEQPGENFESNLSSDNNATDSEHPVLDLKSDSLGQSLLNYFLPNVTKKQENPKEQKHSNLKTEQQIPSPVVIPLAKDDKLQHDKDVSSTIPSTPLAVEAVTEAARNELSGSLIEAQTDAIKSPTLQLLELVKKHTNSVVVDKVRKIISKLPRTTASVQNVTKTETVTERVFEYDGEDNECGMGNPPIAKFQEDEMVGIAGDYSDYIVNGHDVNTRPFFVALKDQVKPGQFLYDQDRVLCGGTILTNWFIVSAAHCFCTYRKFSDPVVLLYCTKDYVKIDAKQHIYRIVAGIDRRDQTGFTYYIDYVRFPKAWVEKQKDNERNYSHDIALIKTSKSIIFRAMVVGKICMDFLLPNENADVFVTGFGITTSYNKAKSYVKCWTNSKGPAVFTECSTDYQVKCITGKLPPQDDRCETFFKLYRSADSIRKLLCLARKQEKADTVKVIDKDNSFLCYTYETGTYGWCKTGDGGDDWGYCTHHCSELNHRNFVENQLQETNLKILPLEQCKNFTSDHLNFDELVELCAGHVVIKNHVIYGYDISRNVSMGIVTKYEEEMLGFSSDCLGDSGGPIIEWKKKPNSNRKRAYLVGVVSRGEGCAFKNKPSILTKIAAFEDWMRNFTDLVAPLQKTQETAVQKSHKKEKKLPVAKKKRRKIRRKKRVKKKSKLRKKLKRRRRRLRRRKRKKPLKENG